MFDTHLAHWRLTPDGAPILTPNARLLPVLWRGRRAMLKIATCEEERVGARVMRWWSGEGAARVFASEGDAILLERAASRSLADLTRGGEDDLATAIACDVVARLHAPEPSPELGLARLETRFRRLTDGGARHGDLFARAASAAQTLLQRAAEPRVLHGDIHHDNILDFGARGWLAIDPKGVIGDRGFDYANLFCNPGPTGAPSEDFPPERLFERRLSIVVERSGLDERRLLQWIAAWCCLSALWLGEDDGDDAGADRQSRIAAKAFAQLDRSTP